MLRYSIAAALFCAVLSIATYSPAAAIDRVTGPSDPAAGPALTRQYCQALCDAPKDEFTDGQTRDLRKCALRNLCAVKLQTGSAGATEFSARKKRKARKVRSGYRGRAAVAVMPKEFCGDRYCASGGAAERDFARGMGRAARNTARGAARVPVAVVHVGGSLVARAEAHLGKTASQLGLPRRLWCSDFMNKIAPGHGTDRRAKSWASAGRPAARGCVGCVAVLTRGRYGGHVGVVKGWSGGNPIIVSGNHNRRVGIGEYSARRIVALRQL